MSEWIKCTDRLPENKWVLVNVTDGLKVTCGFYSECDDNWFVWNGVKIIHFIVTHWMPLRDPPEEE